MSIKTSRNKLVSDNSTLKQNNNANNIKRFSGNTNDTIVRNLITNEIVKPNSLRIKENESSNNWKNISNDISHKLNREIDNQTNIIKSEYNSVKNIKRSATNTNNIIVRNLITNEIVRPSSLRVKENKSSDNEKNSNNDISYKLNRRVHDKKNVIKGANNSIKNTKKFSGNTSNIIVRNLITNEIVKPSSLRIKENKVSDNEKNSNNDILYKLNRRVYDKRNVIKGANNSVKNIKRFSRNTSNIIVRDLITNEIVRHSSLRIKENKLSDNEKNSNNDILYKLNRRVYDKRNVIKGANNSVKNIKRFSRNTSNIIVRNLITNEIVRHSSLRIKENKLSDSEKNSNNDISYKLNRRVYDKKNVIKGANNSIKNIKRFSGNTSNIIVRNLITNEIVKPSSLRKGGSGANGIGKNIRNAFSRKLNSGIDKLANKKVLKNVELDEEAHIDIGSNVIKAKYNSVVTVKHTGKNLIKTAKVVKRLPRNIKKTVNSIKQIPNKIRDTKKTVIISAKELSGIGAKIVAKDFKGAGKQIGKGIVRGSKKTYRTGKKIVRPSFKITNIVGKIGTKQLSNNFKNSIKSKDIEDAGSNVVVDIITGSKTSVLLGAKSIKNVRNLNRNIKSVRRKLKTYNNTKSKLKTANKVNKLNKMIRNPNNFKFASAAQKQVVKLLQHVTRVVKDFIFNAIRVLMSNPVTLGIIAGIVVAIILLEILISMFIGIHGSLTIDFGDNINEWKTQMLKMDEATNQKIHSGNGLVVVNSGYNATWKEVLAVYNVEYGGNMKLSNDSSTSGTNVNTINPNLWEKVYGELKSHLGENYVYGGNSPETGFDCSGFVQYCFGVGGIELPRTTYEQCQSGEDVTNQELQPGDLVFFMGADPQNGLPGHVGVYIGDNEYIHAPTTGDVIKISQLADRSDLWGVRRVISSSADSGQTSSSNNSSSSSNDSSSLYQSIDGTYAQLFEQVGKEYGVDPILLASIAMQESSLDPNSVSSAGACGLCQFMPDTFTGLGFSQSQIFDAYTNCCACAIYIKELLEATNGDLTAALQCYNVGPGAYKSYGGDISRMPQETQEYAGLVLGWYQKFSNGGMPNGAVSSSTSVSSSVSGNLKKIYDLFNTVTRETSKHHHDDGSTSTRVTYILTKHNLREVEESLKMSQDDIDLVNGILEYDNFDDFGADYDFRFKYKC